MRPNTLVLASSLLLCASVLPACSQRPASQVDSGPSGVDASPAKVAFTCVTPGCDSTQTVELAVRGRRRLVVKRVGLEGEAAADITISMAELPPLVVGGGTVVPITLRHVPAKALEAAEATLVVTYADASSDASTDRVPAGEIRVPVRRRLVGESALEVVEKSLALSYAPVGRQVSGALHVRNSGVGNMPLSLGAPSSDSPMIAADVASLAALLPGKTGELPVRFAPTSEIHLVSTLSVPATGTRDEAAEVSIEATSIPEPRLVFESAGAMPAGETVDFGEVPQGGSRTVTMTLANHGGLPARVAGVVFSTSSGNVTASLAGSGAYLSSLERRALTLTLNAAKAGESKDVVCIDDGAEPNERACLRVVATVTNPRPFAEPARVAFGSLARGWVRSAPVRIRNIGAGTLTIRRVSLAAGSSQFFTLQSVPSNPVKLGAQETSNFSIQFQAGSIGTYDASILVETDSPTLPTLTVSAQAVVADCSSVCGFTHGVAACDTGSCRLASCQENFYDVDAAAVNGCECAEPGRDTGDFCANSAELPTLSDSRKGQSSTSGIIPTSNDADFFRFYATDDWNMFGDDFVVKVSVDSADPGIQFCVYRHRGDAPTDECLLDDERCLTTDRVYVATGSQGSDDESEFFVKVFRTAGSTPTCGGYTLHISNGR